MIAKKYGVEIKSLAKVNRLRYPYKIFPRMKLRLPASSDSAQAGFYIVKDGDSLFGIAQRFNVTIRKLRRWNSLSNNQVYPGMRLRILADT